MSDLVFSYVITADVFNFNFDFNFDLFHFILCHRLLSFSISGFIFVFVFHNSSDYGLIIASVSVLLFYVSTACVLVRDNIEFHTSKKKN